MIFVNNFLIFYTILLICYLSANPSFVSLQLIYIYEVVFTIILQEMQLLLLRYREDIISAKVAKEHTESTLKSEILFLKHQVVGEQQEKTTVEETLTQEISQLQEQLGKEDAFSE